ncbi:MAG TPA: hypothetical protein VER11_31170, partial [Polyangiaceae bacterium]|nr:hypothetical protein [Polyangiaceae bacterium]
PSEMNALIGAASQRIRGARAATSFIGALLLVAAWGAGCHSDAPQHSSPAAGASVGGAAGGDAGSDSAGGGLPTGGNAGAGGTINAMWTTDAGKYSLSLDSTYLELDPANGARMTALRVGGANGPNLLADSEVTGQEDNWGSTLWPSPQNWAWPPTDAGSINAINTLPYSAVLEDETLTLTSEVNATAPTVSVIKKFSADLERLAIVIEYTMTNGGTEPVTVAPWEITRVAGAGITFYAEASEPVAHDPMVLPPTTLKDGVRWYEHDPSVSEPTKFFADGKGWIAHAAGDLLLIKSFPDLAPSESPTGEAEIEVFAAPKYVEVENQGAVKTLEPGDSLHWTVHWYARKLATPAVVGSADLVAYVQNQIK